MTRLSVNINKIALLRNSRGQNIPNVLQVAQDCILFGAQGITVHPRPDGRHIKVSDVYELKANIEVELNVEGYPSPDFIKMILEVKPTQCTLVPDPPQALTSQTGWDTQTHLHFLKEIVQTLKEAKIRTSIFLNPDPTLVDSAAQTGTQRIELFTGPYAQQFEQNPEMALQPYIETAKLALEAGLELNAGHDLNLKNLNFLISHIPQIKEVSIGHALICDALYYGLKETIQKYRQALIIEN
ncbi:MAG: pyridoxine 5'-phosphate synthase [Bacteroidia bacterium]|nr:pyridoxine 5'-phosphate synthase [Bacteroidia bacterium]MDW8157695.1 pyridoxine 5'-phosphate synthase [Bacteroidia bacterium]